MKINENDQQTRRKEPDDLSLEYVDSSISYKKGLVEELSSKTGQCPKVDQKGRSECPFAEDLYAEKEDVTEKVEKELQKLQRYLMLVEQEIARCSANLEQISADAGSLNIEQAKERYAAAKWSQESQYNKAVEQRNALIDLIARTEKTLAMARSKKFPGRKPQKGFRFPAGGSEGWEATRSANGEAHETPPDRTSLKTEIESLISVGPLGRKDI